MSRYKLFEKLEEPVLFNLGITGLRMALRFKKKKKKEKKRGGGGGIGGGKERESELRRSHAQVR